MNKSKKINSIMRLKTAALQRHSRYSVWLCTFMIGLGLYIGWLDFIPSALWQEVGLYLSIILSVVIVIASVIYLKRRQLTYHKGIPSLVLRQSFYLLLIFFLYLGLWSGIVHGLGAILHQVVAQPAQLAIVAHKEHQPSRKSCDYRLEAETLKSALPAHICISKTEYASFPEQMTPVRLSGKQSVFGFTVSEWEIRS